MYLSKAIWTKSKWKIMMNFSWRQERYEGHSILIFDDLLSYHFDIHFVVADNLSFVSYAYVKMWLWIYWILLSGDDEKYVECHHARIKKKLEWRISIFFLLLMIECKMKMWICWEKLLQNWCFRQFHKLKWIETFLI